MARSVTGEFKGLTHKRQREGLCVEAVSQRRLRWFESLCKDQGYMRKRRTTEGFLGKQNRRRGESDDKRAVFF